MYLLLLLAIVRTLLLVYLPRFYPHMQQDSFDQNSSVSRSSLRLSLKSSYLRHINDVYQFACESLNLSPFQAKLILLAHEVDNIPELLNLFTIDDDTNQYGHLFFPNQRGICFICEENQQRHSYVSPEHEHLVRKRVAEAEQKGEEFNIFTQRIQFPGRSQGSQASAENPEPEINCAVCNSDCLESEIVKIGGVLHDICTDCFTAYLTEEVELLYRQCIQSDALISYLQINVGKVEKMACPHCSQELTAETIESLVDSRTFKKYQLFLRNKQIQHSKELRWCPNPKCSKIIFLKDEELKKKTAVCKCGTEICTKCNRESHPKKSCDEVFKSQIKQWQNALDLQKCKKCKSVVEKISGCNHMTCGVCRYEWCWLCGATYSPIHFSPLNPFGCPGLQNGDHTSRNWGCFRRSMYRIGLFLLIIILIPIVLPLFLVLSGPVLLVSLCKDTSCFYYRSCCTKFILSVFLSIIGLVFNPLIWVGLLVYFLPQGVSFLANYYRRRRQMNQNTANALRQRLIQQELNN